MGRRTDSIISDSQKKGKIPGKLQNIVSVAITWKLCFVQKAALEEVFRFFFFSTDVITFFENMNIAVERI